MTGRDAGTKIFGPELSAKATKIAVLSCVDKDPRGDFLMVHEDFRRHGIGQWALQALLQVLRDEVSQSVRSHSCVTALSQSRISIGREGSANAAYRSSP